ncbi:helix-turn-helix domain-containing protein [Promicromonospora aerolata]|uniref:Helix-turn-helix domain-containing protein n=1 Tax=Promicromonospora aerolata TaxID=195749 RepID=A0ABW4VFH7_9MICO
MGNRRSRLAERRRALGLTQEVLAARCDVERTTVARWETGFMEPGLWVRARLAEALQVTLQDLETLLAPGPGKEPAIIEVLPDGQERKEARLLLGQLASIAMAPEQSADPAWAEPVDRLTASAPSRIGMVDVEHVQALTVAMRAVDYAHGGGACRDAISAQVRWSQQLLAADATDETRRHLLIALADLHNLAGWASFDVGMFSTARRHFARALEQARHAGDDSLAANILYRLGRLHLHRDLSKEALRFFQLGQLVAQDSCGVTDSMLWVNMAWAYAYLGDRPKMDHAVTAAEDAFGAADLDQAASWVRFFGETDLHAVTGAALTSLPDPQDQEMERAIELVTTTVRLRGPEMARSRTFEHISLAVAHLRIGAHDEGIAYGHQAIDGAASVRSVRTIDRLEPLRVEAAAQPLRVGADDLAQRITELQPAV